jgi:carbamoyltransferase
VLSCQFKDSPAKRSTLGEKVVSIITPSFNQGSFLEYCIKTISRERASGAVEHLVLDGGSKDSSLSVIEKYADVLDYWRSEPDNGQSSAINAGMALAKGDICCWVNSDDGLAPGAISVIRTTLAETDRPAWGIGQCIIVDEAGRNVGLWCPKGHNEIDFILKWRTNYIMQPAVFWTRSMWELAGPLEESLQYTMDFDLWLRFFQLSKPILVQAPIGIHRIQGNSKTSLVGPRIFDEYLWAVDERLSKDSRRKRKARRNICHALSERANAELTYGNVQLSMDLLRKAISVSRLAIVDASFWKVAVKSSIRRGAKKVD